MSLRQQLGKGFLTVLKYTLNPLTRRIVRSSSGPFTLVQHVGRRSGKLYETPIIVSAVEDGFVIELTYGHDVDWHKNVLAADGCTIIWRGKEYVIDQIEPMNAEAGRAAFPQPQRTILRIMGMKHFEKMKSKQEN